MTDPLLELVWEHVLARSKPRQKPVEPVAKPESAYVKPALMLCVHGKRKWQQPGKPACPRCWNVYVKTLKNRPNR